MTSGPVGRSRPQSRDRPQFRPAAARFYASAGHSQAATFLSWLRLAAARLFRRS
jgi:hypothetical protein